MLNIVNINTVRLEHQLRMAIIGLFKHDCDMVNKHTREYVCHATKKYQNRTWEEYQFQSVIQECISQSSKTLNEDELKRLNWLFERDEKTVIKKIGGLMTT